MIPTMWFVGLALGRWWAVPVGAVLWTLAAIIAVQINLGDLPVAVALGGANTAAGVLSRKAVAWFSGRMAHPSHA